MSRYDELVEKIRSMPNTPEMLDEKSRLLDEAEALAPPQTRYDEIIKELAAMPKDEAHIEERRRLLVEGSQILAREHPPKRLQAHFVDDAGKSVWTMEQISEMLECTVDEARRKIAALSIRYPEAKVKGPIHRLN